MCNEDCYEEFKMGIVRRVTTKRPYAHNHSIDTPMIHLKPESMNFSVGYYKAAVATSGEVCAGMRVAKSGVRSIENPVQQPCHGPDIYLTHR